MVLVAKMDFADEGERLVMYDVLGLMVESEIDAYEPGDVLEIKVVDVDPDRLVGQTDDDGNPIWPSPIRNHKLHWKDGEWCFPCGCRLHPDDDNNTHGGGPHIHPCDAHSSQKGE